MGERDNPDQQGETGEDEPRQPPTLSQAEAQAVADELSFERMMEEPPEGNLSIVSDEDVPGAPG